MAINPNKITAIVQAFSQTLAGIVASTDEQGIEDLARNLKEVAERAIVRIEAQIESGGS